MEIGTRIQELRKKKNISQEELANKMNVSRQAVSKWESNLSVPDIEKIIDLCEYFQVSADYLLMGKVQSKKLDNTFVEFYPILSLIIKFILMFVLYYLGAFISGITGVIVYIVFATLVYLLEKKIMAIYSLKKNNIYYELGTIFYSFPFIHLIRNIPYTIFDKLLDWIKDYALVLHGNSIKATIYVHIYRTVKSIQEFTHSSIFVTIYIVLLYVTINFLIIRYIRKRNLNQK